MTNMILFGEKRAHERVSLKLPLRYRILDDTVPARHVKEIIQSESPSQTMDTSLGGLCVTQDGRLKPGQLVNLKLILTDMHETITAFADVVWANESAAGLKFLAVKQRDLDLLLEEFKNARVA